MQVAVGRLSELEYLKNCLSVAREPQVKTAALYYY